MTWEVFNMIGTLAFAASGAIVAMEEDYDLLGFYILGFAAAFGGGAVRNLLIGIPVSELWAQNELFIAAIVFITLIFLFPRVILPHWRKWESFFDAIGLSAFAIQGAVYASGMNHHISAVIVAAVLTGSGGGIIRDILAGRKPVVLRDDVYAAWAVLGGLIIGIGLASRPFELYFLLAALVVLRMLSVHYRWKLPSMPTQQNDQHLQ
ncbi:trimeric intracellular cation channel family protein [Bacillus marinisedimentorum]|uniref:trimeric intracellular cation channel family protein n=1 Tax=Bacillus marinisedimentorum TaxID=1821260 RepID=UPI0007E293A3|nr:trimeric intracellular cation channel family protein [Bacillus marinisedimentorum]